MGEGSAPKWEFDVWVVAAGFCLGWWRGEKGVTGASAQQYSDVQSMYAHMFVSPKSRGGKENGAFRTVNQCACMCVAGPRMSLPTVGRYLRTLPANLVPSYFVPPIRYTAQHTHAYLLPTYLPSCLHTYIPRPYLRPSNAPKPKPNATQPATSGTISKKKILTISLMFQCSNFLAPCIPCVVSRRVAPGTQASEAVP